MTKRFANEQIAFALRQAESGVPVQEVCRKMGVTDVTFYRWKKQFAGFWHIMCGDAYFKRYDTHGDWVCTSSIWVGN